MTKTFSSGYAAEMRYQRGSVLVIALIMLLLLTMLGVSGMRGTGLEERMAGNMRDQHLAFQAAEAALRGAEDQLSPLVVRPIGCAEGSTCTAYAAGTFPSLADKDHDWWLDNATDYGDPDSKDIDEVSADPRYVIEEQSFIRDSLTTGFSEPTGRDIYRVTARGTGQTVDADVRVESSYAKRFN